MQEGACEVRSCQMRKQLWVQQLNLTIQLSLRSMLTAGWTGLHSRALIVKWDAL